MKEGVLAALGLSNPVTAGLTGLSIAGQLFGGLKSAKNNDANQEIIDNQRKDNKAHYDNTVNRDFLETNAAKGIFEQLRKKMKDTNKVIDNTSVVTGGTAEAKIAEKAKVNEGYNDAVSDLASKATAYQERKESDYRREKGRIDSQQIGLNNQKSQNAGNLMGNAANLLTANSFASALND